MHVEASHPRTHYRISRADRVLLFKQGLSGTYLVDERAQFQPKTTTHIVKNKTFPCPYDIPNSKHEINRHHVGGRNYFQAFQKPSASEPKLNEAGRYSCDTAGPTFKSEKTKRHLLSIQQYMLLTFKATLGGTPPRQVPRGSVVALSALW